eukprot:537101_1
MINFIYGVILLILTVSVNSVCNYITVGTTAYQLDTCVKYSTKTTTSRGYYCVKDETTGIYKAQMRWWSNSTDCGVSNNEDATYQEDIQNANNTNIDCSGNSNDLCYCEGKSEECILATKTTYEGTPGHCNENIYEKDTMVIDVCIPSSSASQTSSKLVECSGGGTELRNVIWEKDTICKGEFTTNYDEMDLDTCYDIKCTSDGNKLLYINAFIVVIFKLLY